jgi:hypothetical protein
VPNEEDPTNPDLPCHSCCLVKWEYHKIRHVDAICTREKMSKITLYRHPELGITDRWERDNKLHEVSGWAESRTYRITMDQGICGKPFPLEVRRFKKQPGDVTYKSYTVNSVSRKVKLPPYALANAADTSKQFLDYVENNALAGLEHVAQNDDFVHPIVRRTLKMAQLHCTRLRSDLAHAAREKETGERVDIIRKEAALMSEAIQLWFAIRTYSPLRLAIHCRLGTDMIVQAT